MTTTPSRRRRVQLDNPNATPAPAATQATAASPQEASTLAEDVAEVWRLSALAASAKKNYEDAMEALDQRMTREKRKEFEIPGLRDRPPLVVGYATRTTNVIDPQGFYKLVPQAVFFASVKVGATEAKKHATETALKKITTSTDSAPSLFVKKKPKGK